MSFNALIACNSLLLLCVGCSESSSQSAKEPTQEQLEAAKRAVTALGGTLRKISAPAPLWVVSLRKANNRDLQSLPNLEFPFGLDASGEYTDDGFQEVGRLTNLRLLDLRWSNVTDVGLKHIADLKELRTLDLYYTKVGDAGISDSRVLPIYSNCV